MRILNHVPVIGAAAVIAAFAAGASAQTTSTPPKTTPKTGSQMPAQSKTSQAKVGPVDATFIRTAGRSNKAEIDLAKLAQDKASNPQIKDYAAQIVKDHETLDKDLSDLASKKDVTVPAVTQTEKMSKDTLDKMKGTDFDRAFLADMIRDHQQAITTYTKAAQSTDPDVKAFAEKTLPALKEHLQKAKDLQKQLPAPQPRAGKGGGR